MYFHTCQTMQHTGIMQVNTASADEYLTVWYIMVTILVIRMPLNIHCFHGFQILAPLQSDRPIPVHSIYRIYIEP